MILSLVSTLDLQQFSQLTVIATKSLEGVLKSSSKGTEKYLYGCVLEAQQAGNRQQFIATLHRVLEFHEKHPLDDVRLPVLLRYVISESDTHYRVDGIQLYCWFDRNRT